MDPRILFFCSDAVQHQSKAMGRAEKARIHLPLVYGPGEMEEVEACLQLRSGFEVRRNTQLVLHNSSLTPVGVNLPCGSSALISHALVGVPKVENDLTDQETLPTPAPQSINKM